MDSEENKLPIGVKASQLRKRTAVKILCLLFTLGMASCLLTPTLIAKPAIYLYSDKPVTAEVKLDPWVATETTIPTYYTGWRVFVHPQGDMIDLQPEFTNCGTLPNGFGFEYAKEACKKTSYPYIFWDGKKLFKEIPKKLVGWVVQREDIDKFLAVKADEMGMNEKEKGEFVRYWANQIHNNTSEAFNVYILQNEEVDRWVTLKVKPQPDSWNRIQIVFSPTNPKAVRSPYKLKKIKREGFTLVEWGGTILDEEL